MTHLANVKHFLPATIQTLAALIGLPKTLRLVEELGGTTFPVAQGKTRLGEIRFAALAEVVGNEAATQIAKHFASEKLYIAKCADALRQIRNRSICEEYDVISAHHGSPTAVVQLALKYRLSDRQIEKILKQPLPVLDAPLQEELF